MEHRLTRFQKSETEIEVTIPFSEFEPLVKKAAILISEKMDIEGFRRGKAPYDIVKNKVDEAAIYEEAAELAVRKTYPEAMKRLTEDGTLDGAHPPIGKPEITITKLAAGNELIYKVKLALLPQISLPDYKTIAQKACAKKETAAISDEEVQKAVQWLRQARTKLITVNRKAEKGDRVEVDFEIRHNGVKIEGGESKNHPLILGEGRFLPGFEDELAGLETGERKEFTLTAPGDWRDKNFAGKALNFSAEMKLVQERKIPELTDDFAKTLGGFASLDAMRASIRDGILAEKQEKETQRIRGAMIQAIAKEAGMEVPQTLIDAEVEKMADELRRGIAEMGMSWPDYLLHIKKTKEELKKEWQKEGENRVRVALTLREIGLKEHIEPTEEELAEREQQMLANFRAAAQAQRAIDPVQLREYTHSVLRNERVFEFLEKA